MKNPNNTPILKKFLSRYITNIMKDIYGPRIDEKTGLTINTPSQLAQKLIKKANKVNKKLATSAAENRLLEPLGYSQ